MYFFKITKATILLCFIFIVSGCVGTQKSFPPKLSAFFKNSYLPIRDSSTKLKAFSASINPNGGSVASFTKSQPRLENLAKESLANCIRDRKKYGHQSKCKVTHLGNNAISYNTEDELNKLIIEYKNRLMKKEKKLSSLLSDEELCSKSTLGNPNGTRVWNGYFPAFVASAKNRNLDCGTSFVFVDNANKYAKNKSNSDIAVIIGNTDYSSNGKDIPNVPPAQNDAKNFKRFAENQLGIHKDNIIHLKDATSGDLERTFGNERSFKGNAYNWVRPHQSNLYVYYAGHSAPGEDGSSYLVPVDATASSIDLNGYPVETLYKNLSLIPSKSTTVILESCFSGNSASGSVITNASPVYMKAKNTNIPANLTVLTAGSANELASWTTDKRNGLFTQNYIKGMSGEADGPDYGNEDGVVSMGELQAYLDDTVTYYARRHYGRSQNVQITVAQWQLGPKDYNICGS